MSASSSNSSSSSRRSSNVSCTICSERYKAADKIYGGSCGHVFHWQCLQRWWEESNSCPVCRSSGQEFFQLYLSFEDSEQSHSQIQSRSQNQSQSQNSGAGQRNAQDDLTQDFQNLLYESDLFREEIEFLNTQISFLMVKLALSSDSNSDSE
ncbi:E3 ubiquitin-protein ligase RNF128 [Drosophila hydei]|uniref:RING-type E3 ubiquitin transferase n=1 Tax=Drosophila hydei TaxID=7224 RepID=A0A6J1M8T3_DROHY|nr:E3 ubiquitin-protein ligase RNF128 [Drosophila hydei]